MTFGSPRTGLEAFANKCGENMQPRQNSWRFANKFDPVPMVPPRFMTGYTHIDAGYKLYKDQDPKPIPSERTNKDADADADAADDRSITTHGQKCFVFYW